MVRVLPETVTAAACLWVRLPGIADAASVPVTLDAATSAIFALVTVRFPYFAVGIVLSTMLLPWTTTGPKRDPIDPSALRTSSSAALPLEMWSALTVPSPTSDSCVWMI